MTPDDILEVMNRGDRIAKVLDRLELPSDPLTATALIGVMAGMVQTLGVRRAWAHATLDSALNDLGVP